MKNVLTGAAAALCLMGCLIGGSDTTSGGSTVLDPKATRVLFPSGRGAEGIVARLYPPDYNALFPKDSLTRLIREAVSDEGGFVRFPKTDSDAVYNLLARDPRTGLTVFIPGRRLREGFGTKAWLSEPWRLEVTLTHPAPDTFAMSGRAFIPGSDVGQRWCLRGASCILVLPRTAGMLLHVEGDGTGLHEAWGRYVPLPAPPPGPGTYRNLRVSPDGSRDSLWDKEYP